MYIHDKYGDIENFYNVTYQMYYQPIIEGVYKDYFSVEKGEKDGNTTITFIITDKDGYWKRNEKIIRTEYPELDPTTLGNTDYIPSKRDIKKIELQFIIIQMLSMSIYLITVMIL